MRAAIFCMCLLGYVSISASERSEPGNGWPELQVPLPSVQVSKKARMKQTKIRPTAYKLPGYVYGDDASAVTEQKKLFHYNNRGPLTDKARAVMLPTAMVAPVTIKDPLPMVEALCHLDRMYVRIRKDSVNETDGWKFLYFGKCRVNQARGPHYYFLYPLTRCGLRPQLMDNYIVFTNVVRYLRKPASENNIIRNASLTVPVSCKFPRFHRTYDVGVHPLLGPKSSKTLPSAGVAYIIVLDENWNPLAPGTIFVLAQAIHFEVRVGAGWRAFVNRCWITPTSKPNILLPFTPIQGYGCMVDSVDSSLSRFHYHADPAVLRFTIESFVYPLEPDTQALTIHCEVTTARTATLFRKACSFNKITSMWDELHTGGYELCMCCESGCSNLPKHRAKTISSPSWNVGDSEKDFEATKDWEEEDSEADEEADKEGSEADEEADEEAVEEGSEAVEEGSEAVEEGSEAVEEGSEAVEEGSEADEEGSEAEDIDNYFDEKIPVEWQLV